MEIKSRAFHTLAISFPKPDSHTGFIWTFVLAKTGIAVNPKKALVYFGNRIYSRRDFPESLTHGNDKFPGGKKDIFFVFIAVFIKPLFSVVFF